jgi:hypothetical protein
VRVPSEPEQRLAQDFLLMPTESSLVYLDGALPGDFGFDPLGLFDPQVTSQEERTWLVTSEVIHGELNAIFLCQPMMIALRACLMLVVS